MTDKAPVYAAECLRKTGRVRQSRQILNEYLTHYPVDPEAHIQMALIARKRENFDLYAYHLRVVMNVWKDSDPDYKPRLA